MIFLKGIRGRHTQCVGTGSVALERELGRIHLRASLRDNRSRFQFPCSHIHNQLTVPASLQLVAPTLWSYTASGGHTKTVTLLSVKPLPDCVFLQKHSKLDPHRQSCSSMSIGKAMDEILQKKTLRQNMNSFK